MTVDAVPSRPIRQWLIAWTRTTGDPPWLTAAGFDLDPALIAELLGPDPPRLLNIDLARRICERLRADPQELWRQDLAVQLGQPTWPTEPLWAEL